MATLAEQASKLLDFDQKLDITLLDSIVGCMYSGAGEQVRVVTSSQTLLFQTLPSSLIHFQQFFYFFYIFIITYAMVS